MITIICEALKIIIGQIIVIIIGLLSIGMFIILPNLFIFKLLSEGRFGLMLISIFLYFLIFCVVGIKIENNGR
jgi:hypothetical protein